jgi:hypothetical protein
MVKRFRFVLALALWAQSLSAASPQVMVNLHDCGGWLEARQAKQVSALEGYVVGMVTGMTVASNVPLLGSPQAATRNEQIYFWVDEYCRKNPLKYLEEAMIVFANEVSHNAYQQAVERAMRANGK